MEINTIKARIDYLHLLFADAGVRVVVNPHTDESYYHFKKKYINIGLKSFLNKPGVDPVKVAELLYFHEVSHHINSQIVEGEMPHWLVNILEDHRIEWSIKETVEDTFGKNVSFAPLHEASFDAYYRSGKALETGAVSGHPVFWMPVANLLVLERWSVWTNRDHLAELEEKFGRYKGQRSNELSSPKEQEEFRQDCKKVLSDAVSATSTPELVGKTIWFYRKWKNLFDGAEMPEGIPALFGGRADTDAEKIEGSLPEEVREFIDQQLSDDTPLSEDKETKREWRVREEKEKKTGVSAFSDTPFWNIDEGIIQALQKTVRTIITINRTLQSEKSPVGRRPDPRRTENLLPNPFRRRQEVVAKSVPKTLFVIDGSGSMSGKPFYDATHLAVAFEEELGADIVITAPDRYYRVKARDLIYAKCNGGTENLVSTAELLDKYDLVIFFTDANVSEEDERFLKKNKKKKVVGLLTTYNLEDANSWLPQFFERYVVAEDIQSLAKELAFLLRRG